MSYFEGRTELGEAAMQAIVRATPDIAAISADIFENPESAFAEERAVRLLTDFLASSGFAVERNLAGLPTAFLASSHRFDTEAMRKGLRHGHVAILAEYDADGERGHTTGRHLVAGAALASGFGLASALSGLYGQVTVIGCPAASIHEGKRLLAAAGVFEPADAALGARPASTRFGFQPTINATGETFATSRLRARFTGPAAESDARQRLATAAESIVGNLSETEQLQVILTEDGVDLDLRSESNPDLDLLIARLRNLAESTAADTGTTVEFEVLTGSPSMNVNRVLARRIKTFGDNIGLKQNRAFKASPTRESDWGHVSLVTPAVEAAYPISEFDLESGSDEFKAASVSQFAYDQMLTTAMAVALAGLDLLGDMEMRGFAEGELIRTVKAQGRERTPRRWLGVHPVMPRESSNGQGSLLGTQAPPRDRS